MNLQLMSLFSLLMILVCSVLSVAGDDYVPPQFRTLKITGLWKEASKLIKGQKVKALATDLKAHEKLILSLKKKRHTVESANDETELTQRHELNRQAAEDELQLEKDLISILTRYHLPASLMGSSSEYASADQLHSDNHVNSVLGSASRHKEKRFTEARVESLYRQALELASRLFRESDESNDKDRRRRKEFEPWLLQLENDLEVLQGKVKKLRILEGQLDRLGKKHEEDNHVISGKKDTWTQDKDEAESSDVRRRMKELSHKIRKAEKELGDRIIQQKIQLFPTSRNLGDL